MKQFISIVLVVIVALFNVGCNRSTSEEKALEEFHKAMELEGAKMYDLRNQQLCRLGHIEGFRCIMGKNLDGSMRTLEDIIETLLLDSKSQVVVLICEYGNDAKIVREALIKAGHSKVYYFQYGYVGYVNQMKDAFVPVVTCEDEC